MLCTTIFLSIYLLVTTNAFNFPSSNLPISFSAPIGRTASPCLAASMEETQQTEVDNPQDSHDGSKVNLSEFDKEIVLNNPRVSRRYLLRGALWGCTMCYTSRKIECASAYYKVTRVEPEERKIYAESQKNNGPLRVLWVGAGDLKGVFKELFLAGNEVVALDLRRPAASELDAATAYATDHNYRLQFEQGDATNLNFADETFDVVVSSLFLCQDFDPEVVVSEIRRVLKPGGRFGFYEHVEDICDVIVDKVFGERSVIRVQAYPEKTNIIAGVVKKV